MWPGIALGGRGLRIDGSNMPLFEAYSLLYIKHRSAEKKLLYINVIKNIFVLIHFAQT